MNCAESGVGKLSSSSSSSFLSCYDRWEREGISIIWL